MKKECIRIGCSGWYYQDWKNVVYPAGLPTTRWFAFYQGTFDTVELNAPFYHWPKPTTVQSWVRQAKPGFQYSIKVNRYITHLKRFHDTKQMVGEFYQMADTLGELMGCFLFQLPPSFHYSPERLSLLLDQLEPHYRNAVEFRHASWWNEQVFDSFREAGLIFCSVSGPGLPEDLIQTAAAIYVRFHGTKDWYRHDYSEAELEVWAKKLHACHAKETWVYFNNDYGGNAFRNAQSLRRRLQEG